ncbi:MAG: flagellar hook-associated protein FlgL [Anaerolineaceae bacterium]|nr:flagellar hook-associated protein FlgL [Anaerolineaceae bacterium]
MRITHRLQTDNSIQNMRKSLEKLYELQIKAASGKKYRRASENPAKVSDTMSMNSSLRILETYSEAIHTTKEWMEMTDFALTRISDDITRAKSLTLDGLDDGSLNARDGIVAEIDGIIEQVVEMANTKDVGRYVFGGFLTKTTPFEFVPGGSVSPVGASTTVTIPSSNPANPDLTIDYPVDSVIFNGDDNIIERDISGGETIQVSVNGGEAFSDGTGGQVFDPAVKDMYATLIRIRDVLAEEDYLKPHVSSNLYATPPGPPAIEVAVPFDDPNLDPALLPAGLPDPSQPVDRALLEEAYVQLQEVHEIVLEKQNGNGSRLRLLETALERATTQTLELKGLISRNEDVDFAQIAAEIGHQELIYQTTISVSGRVSAKMSLFDALA